jgi:hypothetical protein
MSVLREHHRLLWTYALLICLYVRYIHVYTIFRFLRYITSTSARKILRGKVKEERKVYTFYRFLLHYPSNDAKIMRWVLSGRWIVSK